MPQISQFQLQLASSLHLPLISWVEVLTVWLVLCSLFNHQICTLTDLCVIGSGQGTLSRCVGLLLSFCYNAHAYIHMAGCRICHLSCEINFIFKIHRIFKLLNKYRVIHKSVRDFRTRLRNKQDRHGRKEHINR